jgi:D-3-phosphoglycerate dehydrogenase
VDNIDIDAATARGVLVLNSPAGNTISTAELTFSMLMAMARKIPQATASMKAGQWNRKEYLGTELYNKTLGILGVGRVGTEVARRAIAFGMKVLAYDPYISSARAQALQIDISENLDDLYRLADFITIHMPLNAETKNMLNSAAFAKMKKGVRLLNCARGGIIDEAQLYAAIQSGQIAGAALDVYQTEPPPPQFPLRNLPQVIMTPHLGASTEEAQENVGIEIAAAITDYLLQGVVRNAVNLPNIDAQTRQAINPHLVLAEKLGRLVGQLAPKRNDRIVITLGGQATELPGDPLVRALLKGFLEPAAGPEVNQVNVRLLATSLGIVVQEIKSTEKTDFNQWLHVCAFSNDEETSAVGSLFGAKMMPRIVQLLGQPCEIIPEGVLFVMRNKDRPGMVGYLGTLMGSHNINIANMSLSRNIVGGEALTVLNLDSVPSTEVLAELRKCPDIRSARVVLL